MPGTLDLALEETPELFPCWVRDEEFGSEAGPALQFEGSDTFLDLCFQVVNILLHCFSHCCSEGCMAGS